MIKIANDTRDDGGIYGILEGTTNSDAEKNLISNYTRVPRTKCKYPRGMETYGVPDHLRCSARHSK
jgi:hypothetical protein